MTDLPYQAEYAKSGRAACKGCKQKIDQGALRIAVMMQSAFHDGKQPNWHHEECFFRIKRLTTIADIGNFNKLKNADQKRIKKAMENSTGIVMPEAKDKGESNKTADESSASALKDFQIEYAKSSRATCRHCEIKICKDEVRIAKTMYYTKVGTNYWGQPLWHHVICFAEKRSSLLYFADGESLPGFKSLSKEDQAMVKKMIKPFKADEVPVKKLKHEPKDEAELKEEKENEKKIEKQNKLFHKHRSALSELAKNDLKKLLEVNSQEIPAGQDECLDRLADMMAFGALESCSECKQGQLVLDTFGYRCTGNVSEWTKCSYVTQNPKRVPMKVPKAYKEGSIFKKYKPKTDVRLFEAAPRPVMLIVKDEPDAAINKNIPIPSLKNLQFYLYGKLKDKEETKKRILKLGGLCVSKPGDTIAAIVSTKKDVERMSEKMEEFKNMDIEGSQAASSGDNQGQRKVAEVLDGKVLIFRVYSYLRHEYEELKAYTGNRCDLSPLANILKRTSSATGVSEHIIARILDEKRRSGQFQDEVPEKRAKLSHEAESSGVSPTEESSSCDTTDNIQQTDDAGQQEQEAYEIKTLKIEVDEEAIQYNRTARCDTEEKPPSVNPPQPSASEHNQLERCDTEKETTWVSSQQSSCEPSSANPQVTYTVTCAEVKIEPPDDDYQLKIDRVVWRETVRSSSAIHDVTATETHCTRVKTEPADEILDNPYMNASENANNNASRATIKSEPPDTQTH